MVSLQLLSRKYLFWVCPLAKFIPHLDHCFAMDTRSPDIFGNTSYFNLKKQAGDSVDYHAKDENHVVYRAFTDSMEAFD